MIVELVTSAKLAKRLQISPWTLIAWRRSGFLAPATTINNVHHYTVESVNEILQCGATNLRNVVSVTDVLRGKTNLLTLKQAAEKLGTTTEALRHRIERDSYPAIKLFGEWRMVETDVDGILARINSSDYMLREKAAHIFGTGIDYIKERIQCGELYCVTISQKPITRPITLESILALLQKITPQWVNPETWVAERQEDDRPLMGLREFERFLGLSANTGQSVLSKRKIAYLQTEGGSVKISPISATKQLIQQAQLTAGEIATVFGVDEHTVKKAWRSGDLQCHLHYHVGSELRQACIVEMLSFCLSPGVSQRIRWYERRLNSSKPLLSIAEAAVFFKVSEEKVVSLLQNGKLRGVKLPGPYKEWRIEKNTR